MLVGKDNTESLPNDFCEQNEGITEGRWSVKQAIWKEVSLHNKDLMTRQHMNLLLSNEQTSFSHERCTPPEDIRVKETHDLCGMSVSWMTIL